MNEQSMHDFFRKNEMRMDRPIGDDEPVDDVEAGFDGFIKARSGKAFGFYLEDDFYGLDRERPNWDAVVWIPRSMIDAGQVHVKRLDNESGFMLSMPAWLAAEKGII